MRKLISARPIILTLMLLLGCSQGSVEKTPPVTLPSVTLGESDAAQMIGQAQVTCSKAENCNESTGMLLIAANDGVHACTAGLIAPDVLMTSAYCLDSLKLSGGSDCSSNVWIKFPAIGGLPAESEECSTVIKTTPYVDGVDNQVAYAFLKLKSATRRLPLDLNFDGFNDQQVFSVYKFDYSLSGKQVSGVMNRVSCRSVQNSLALPEFNRPEAPLGSLTGCDLIDGNSGAPLLDSQGQVHGVIQAGKPSAYQSQFLPYLLDAQVGDRYDSINLGTNLGCMSSQEALPNRNPDPACGNAVLFPDVAPSFSSLKVTLQPELDDIEKTFVHQMPELNLSPHVQWSEGEILTSCSILAEDVKNWGGPSAVLGMAPIPVCIAHLDSWIQSYSGGIFGMKKTADEPMNLPITIYRLGLDQGEVPSFRQSGSATVAATLHFNPQELLHRKAGTFEIRIGQGEVIYSSVIQECADPAVGPSPQ